MLLKNPIRAQLRAELAGEGSGVGGTKLDLHHLCSNPHPEAWILLKPEIERRIQSGGSDLARNPHREAILPLTNLSSNTSTEVVEWLIANPLWIENWAFAKNTHPAAVAHYAAHPSLINWQFMSMNQSAEAVVLLRKNKEKIVWNGLSKNPHPDAVALLIETPDNINWFSLSKNESAKAATLLRENRDKIHWSQLSLNSHPDAVELLLETPENIVWENFIMNSSLAAHLYIKADFDPSRDAHRFMFYKNLVFNQKQSSDAILWLATIIPLIDGDWNFFWENSSLAALAVIRKQGIADSKGHSSIGGIPHCTGANPDIFENVYDYVAIRENMDLIREDLAKACGHPARLMRHLEAGGDPDDF